jgi:hypothetical protein
MRFALVFDEGLHGPFNANLGESKEGGRHEDVIGNSCLRHLFEGQKRIGLCKNTGAEASLSLVLISVSSVALAQDSSPPTIHGFDDLAFKNDYITPHGLLVTNK